MTRVPTRAVRAGHAWPPRCSRCARAAARPPRQRRRRRHRRRRPADAQPDAAASAAPAVNPFTGSAPVPTEPVVAVKIDDTGNGRPQVQHRPGRRRLHRAGRGRPDPAAGGLRRPTCRRSRRCAAPGPATPSCVAQYGADRLRRLRRRAEPAAGARPVNAEDVDQRPRRPGLRPRQQRAAPYNLTANLARSPRRSTAAPGRRASA